MTVNEIFAMVQRMTNMLRTSLKRLMDERQLNMKELSLAAGLGETAVRDIIERGRNPRAPTVIALAKTLGVSVSELMLGDLPTYQRIPIVGQMSAGESWVQFEDDQATVEMRMEGDAVAIVVRGDAMAPAYRDGDVLVGTRKAGSRPDNLVGLDCIVMTDDNKRYVKILTQGSMPGRFDLRSYTPTKPDIRNVRIKWAAPVVWVKRSQR